MRQSLFVWLIHIIVYAAYAFPSVDTAPAFLFAILSIVTQASILCLPLFVLAGLSRISGAGYLSTFAAPIAKVVLPLASIGLLVMLYANYTLYDMYGFYIDSFVINLISVPGGIDALGASNTFYLTVGSIIILIVLLYFAITHFVPIERLFARILKKPAVVFTALAIAAFSQAGAYALSDYKSYVPILRVADHIPWYAPVTAKSLLSDIGLERSRDVTDMVDMQQSEQFSYPKPMSTMIPLDKSYNIVWLVAESWRWDMLDPEIMPATWRFAQKSNRFLSHYSSGNGTRMGLFGQFYGLAGSFWFPALKYQQSPFLIDVLQSSGYEIQAHTSAAFTYPEFDKTIWANVAQDRLKTVTTGKSWERDRKNVEGLVSFIDKAQSPFLAFMFFESTHANYNFPLENELRSDYLENFDYLSTDIGPSIDLIKNRYINASNHLDSQLGLVFQALESQGRLEDTIVIVTGDHGEEFMENGHWGHNSSFTQQQIRVPLLIHVPGQGGAIMDTMTSHLDLPATIFSILRPGTDSLEYSMGEDLLSPAYSREFSVVSDWHGDALVTQDFKFSMSSKANSRRDRMTTIDDKSLAESEMPAELSNALYSYMSDRLKFSRHSTEESNKSIYGVRVANHKLVD